MTSAHDRGRRRVSRPTLAEAVTDGLYIAAAATRLSLKNHILMQALAHHADFDIERIMGEAATILRTLADEADADADRAGRERRAARGRFGGPDGTHDYGRRDVRNLRRRERQSAQVAIALRARADDPEQLRALVLAAREAAWDELSMNIDHTLRIVSARPDLKPDYAQQRASRMRSIRLVDLPELARRRRPDSPPEEAVG